MKLRILAASTAALIAAATLVAAPAEAAAFGVTLKTSTAKADVNKTFTLSGKVTGTGSAKKSIIVQRKIGSAPWKNYSTITTGTTGTYSKAFTMASVGAKSFRVLVPKTSKLTTGTSTTVKVTGYTWLRLYDQRYLTGGSGGGGIIIRGYYGELNGKVPPADTFTMAGQTSISWSLAGLCDSLHGSVEVNDDGVRPPQTFTIERGSDDDTFTIERGESRSLDFDATDVGSFTVRHTNGSTSSDYVALVAPRAHCSATALPLAND